jgi:uncharacterized membrane protein YsdA (DUF1294 family)
MIYTVIITIAAFSSMGIDKKRAKKKQWRIKESTLFLLAILGGSIGSILGMYTFRHKTKHKKFVIGMPVILAIQVMLGIIMIHYL